jgi:tetratricopeptide (TPR) repeat protein
MVEGLEEAETVFGHAGMAHAYALMGDRRGALEMMEPVTNSGSFPYRELTYASVHLKLGDFADALKYARKAREVSRFSESGFWNIAQSHTKANRLKEAWQVTEEITDGTLRVPCIVGIALAQHRAGRKDEAAESLRYAVRVAETASLPPTFKHSFFSEPAQKLFGSIAEAQGELGEVAAARAWIGRQIAANNQAYALIGLAEGLHKRRQGESKK